MFQEERNYFTRPNGFSTIAPSAKALLPSQEVINLRKRGYGIRHADYHNTNFSGLLCWLMARSQTWDSQALQNLNVKGSILN